MLANLMRPVAVWRMIQLELRSADEVVTGNNKIGGRFRRLPPGLQAIENHESHDTRRDHSVFVKINTESLS